MDFEKKINIPIILIVSLNDSELTYEVLTKFTEHALDNRRIYYKLNKLCQQTNKNNIRANEQTIRSE